MATTTNYSWETPDDTDLVKDGAAAIRTLGSSIDTTTKNLNPSTTLGDIEYRSSTANTNTRLAIGTTGQVLSVSGGVPAWADAAGGAGNLAQVATGTLSGTSVSLTGLSSYTELLLIMKGVLCGANAYKMRFTFNSNSGSNYVYTTFMDLNNNPDRDADGVTATYFQIPDSFSQQANGNNNILLKMTNCKNPGFTDFDVDSFYRTGSGATEKTHIFGKGIFTNAAAVSSFQIGNDGGFTFTAGTYTLWGA